MPERDSTPDNVSGEASDSSRLSDPVPEHPGLSHEQLLAVVHQHPEDHGGYGDAAQPHNPQCSDGLGCKFFHALEGARGMDWGVCGNPESHRAGLLTFEHQGCPKFESVEN